MEETISPAIIIPVVMACFIAAVWLTASFCNQRWTQKIYDVRQDLKTTAEHHERYRQLYFDEKAKLKESELSYKAMFDKMAVLHNRLLRIRGNMELSTAPQLLESVVRETQGINKHMDLWNPPSARGAHTLSIGADGEPKINTKKL